MHRQASAQRRDRQPPGAALGLLSRSRALQIGRDAQRPLVAAFTSVARALGVAADLRSVRPTRGQPVREMRSTIAGRCWRRRQSGPVASRSPAHIGAGSSRDGRALRHGPISPPGSGAWPPHAGNGGGDLVIVPRPGPVAGERRAIMTPPISSIAPGQGQLARFQPMRARSRTRSRLRRTDAPGARNRALSRDSLAR